MTRTLECIQERLVLYVKLEKMKKLNFGIRLIIFAGVLYVSTPALAQQEGQYLNLATNPFMVNPAAGGLSDVFQLELLSRRQWMGYNGGPRSLFLVGHSQFKVGKAKEDAWQEFNSANSTLFQSPERTVGKMKHIVGGKALYEAIGPFVKTSAYGSYAFHLPFTRTVNFGAGIGLGWSNLGLDQDRVVLYQTDDSAYDQFLGNSSSQNILDANAGVVFYGKKLFVGLSATQFLKNDVVFQNVVTESNFNRHYFVVAKYQFTLNEQFELEPTAVAKFAENSPFSGDFGARLIYGKSSWFALQYRTSNALTFQLGSNLIKNIYLSYGYELGIGPLRAGTNGTHELQLGFYLGKNRNVAKEIKEKSKE